MVICIYYAYNVSFWSLVYLFFSEPSCDELDARKRENLIKKEFSPLLAPQLEDDGS